MPRDNTGKAKEGDLEIFGRGVFGVGRLAVRQSEG